MAHTPESRARAKLKQQAHPKPRLCHYPEILQALQTVCTVDAIADRLGLSRGCVGGCLARLRHQGRVRRLGFLGGRQQFSLP